MIGPGGGTNLRRTETMSVEAFNGSMVDSEGGSDPCSTNTMSMMEHLSLELLEDGLDSFRTIHIRNQQDDKADFKTAGTVPAAELQSVIDCDNETTQLVYDKDLSIRDAFDGRSRTPPTTRMRAPVDLRTQWYCGNCHSGPMNNSHDAACVNCHMWKDNSAYSPKPRTLKGTDRVQKPPR